MNPDRPDAKLTSVRRKLVEQETSGEIIGAFYTVYNTLGYGLSEIVYLRALEVELGRRGVCVQREVPVEIVYQGVHVGTYRIDMVVERRVVVEVKATQSLADASKRQLLSYVTAIKLDLGLLLHFGPRAAYYRILGKRSARCGRNDQAHPGDP